MNTTTIYEHNSKNYTKTGKLHKRAEAIYTSKDHTAEEDAKAIKNWFGGTIESIEKPYVFTHLILMAQDKRYIVYTDYTQEGWPNPIMTSPTKLYQALMETE